MRDIYLGMRTFYLIRHNQVMKPTLFFFFAPRGGGVVGGECNKRGVTKSFCTHAAATNYIRSPYNRTLGSLRVLLYT